MSTRRATRATASLSVDNHKKPIPCPHENCISEWDHAHSATLQQYLPRPEILAAKAKAKNAQPSMGSKRRAQGSPDSENVGGQKNHKHRKVVDRKDSPDAMSSNEPVRLRGLNDKFPVILPKHRAEESSDSEDPDAPDTHEHEHRKIMAKEDSIDSPLSEESIEEDGSPESESEVSKFEAEDTESDADVEMTNEDDDSDSDLSSVPAADSGAEDEETASPTHNEEDGHAMDVDDDSAQPNGSPRSLESVILVDDNQKQGEARADSAVKETGDQVEQGEHTSNMSTAQPPTKVTPDMIRAGYYPGPSGWAPPNPDVLPGPFTSPDYRPTGEEIAQPPYIREMTRADQLAVANYHPRAPITSMGTYVPVAAPTLDIPPVTPARQPSPTESEKEYQLDASPDNGRSLFGPFSTGDLSEERP